MALVIREINVHVGFYVVNSSFFENARLSI